MEKNKNMRLKGMAGRQSLHADGEPCCYYYYYYCDSNYFLKKYIKNIFYLFIKINF
jgi:hypothetical protein